MEDEAARSKLEGKNGRGKDEGGEVIIGGRKIEYQYRGMMRETVVRQSFSDSSPLGLLPHLHTESVMALYNSSSALTVQS